MNYERDRLYKLMPSYLRDKDSALGQPLHLLLDAIESEFRRVAQSADALHANSFIETCEPWAVRYLSDLVGENLSRLPADYPVSLRAFVADVVRLRQSKGTAAALEQACRGISGWPVLALETRERVGASRELNHAGPQPFRRADIRALGSPSSRLFGLLPAAYTLDVRVPKGSIAFERGQQAPAALNAVALAVCRLQSFQNRHAQPFRLGHGHYSLHPLGCRSAVFNPRPDQWPQGRLRDSDLPFALDAMRWNVRVKERVGQPEAQAVRLYVNAAGLNEAPHWNEIPLSIDARSTAKGGGLQARLDLRQGFFRLNHDVPAEMLRADYASGFSGPLGGGAYYRVASTEGRVFVIDTQQNSTTKALDLDQALQEAAASGQSATVLIADNAAHSFSRDASRLQLKAGQRLTLMAASRCRPALHGHLAIQGEPTSLFSVSGVLWCGALAVKGCERVTLEDMTLWPESSGADHHKPSVETVLAVQGSGAHACEVHATRALLGPVSVHGSAAELHLRDCIVDGFGAPALGRAKLPVTRVNVANATLFGEVFADEMPLAVNALFTRSVRIQRHQSGAVNHSAFSMHSRLPSHSACLQFGALRVESWFESVQPGAAAYGQLAQGAPRPVREGGTGGSEMGVFHGLWNAERERQLRSMAPRYTPASMHAAIYFMS